MKDNGPLVKSVTTGARAQLPPRQAHSLRPLVPEGWAVLLALYGYPILWILGLSSFIWTILLVPITIHLLRRDDLHAPRGVGAWMLFLAWVVLSLAGVGSLSTAAVFFYRASIYLASGALLIYVYNLPRVPKLERRILLGVGAFWAFLAIGGIVAIIAPDLSLTSALELLLPASITNEPFVNQLIHPVVAQLHDFLGFPIARPALPFAFTNEWGSNVALFAPIFVFASRSLRRPVRWAAIVFGALAIVPIIQSLNRGLWLCLVAAIFYVAVRHAIQGSVRPLLITGTGAFAIAIVLLTTPLGDLVTQRAETGHSDSARLHLVSGAVEAMVDSPLIGHGGTVRDPERASRAPAGTHGQLWMVGVSHGVPAALTFVTFIAIAFMATLLTPVRSVTFWCNVMLFVLFIQLFFYTALPSQLPIVMIVLGLALREIDQHNGVRASPKRSGSPASVPQ